MPRQPRQTMHHPYYVCRVTCASRLTWASTNPRDSGHSTPTTGCPASVAICTTSARAAAFAQMAQPSKRNLARLGWRSGGAGNQMLGERPKTMNAWMDHGCVGAVAVGCFDSFSLADDPPESPLLQNPLISTSTTRIFSSFRKFWRLRPTIASGRCRDPPSFEGSESI